MNLLSEMDRRLVSLIGIFTTLYLTFNYLIQPGPPEKKTSDNSLYICHSRILCVQFLLKKHKYSNAPPCETNTCYSQFMEPGPKWLQIIWCCLFGHQHCICKLQCKFLFPSGGLDILFHYSTSYSVKAEHNSATQILQYKHCSAVGK